MPRNPVLRQTLETLLTPLGSGFTDSWRDTVNRHLRRWVGTDCAFFRVSDESPTRIDPLSEDLLAARDHYRQGGFRDLDPWAVQRVGPGETLVASFRDLLGEHWQATSAYYRKLLLPTGITSYVGAQIGTDDGGHVVLSYFNMWKPEDEAVIARTRRRIHALIPALQAGVEVWLAVRPALEELGAMVDEIPEALLLCDETGRAVHANTALHRMAGGVPDEERFQDALSAVAREFTRARNSGDVHDLYSNACERIIHTVQGVYVVRPVVAEGRLRGGDTPENGVLLLVRRRYPLSIPQSPPRAAGGESVSA